MVAQHHTDLSIARQQMLQNILQIEDLAALRERQRIARDIHDSLGNALTSLNIQLQTAHKLWHLDPNQAEKFLAEAQRLGAIAIQEVRQSVRNMREIVPIEESLTSLIDSVVQNFHQVTGILPATTINIPVDLSAEVVQTIYRIIQEALTNICKYARATKVEINLDHTCDHLSLVIQDNGKGFKPSQKRTGFGLQGMQERVLALKGDLKIDSEPGYGCQIIVNLPLQQQKNCEKATAQADISLAENEPIQNINTSVTEYSLENSDILPPEEIFVPDFNLTNNDTTPLELISAIAFNLKLIDTTILQNLAAQNINLQLLETIPQAETTAEDGNLQLIEQALPVESNLQSFDLEEKVNFFFPETKPETKTHPDNLSVDSDFISQCQTDLAKLIGPIADYLVKKMLRSSPEISHLEFIKKLAWKISDPQKALSDLSYQEIIDKLSVHLAPHQETESLQQSKLLGSESLSQPQIPSNSENVPISSHSRDDEPISESFVRQCERDLAECIGPMATFVVKKAVKHSLSTSRAELIKILAAKIPDSQKAEQFQQHLLS